MIFHCPHDKLNLLFLIRHTVIIPYLIWKHYSTVEIVSVSKIMRRKYDVLLRCENMFKRYSNRFR